MTFHGERVEINYCGDEHKKRVVMLLIMTIVFAKHCSDDITNTVKCRPPNNRVPSVKEKETCNEYLQKEIEIISGTNIYNENNDFHQIAPYLAKFMPKTEIVYLARIDRKKQSNLNYLNIHNLLNKKITLKKIFYIQTIGQLNHLRNIYKSENVGFFNIDGLWFLIPTKKNKMKQTESKFINELSSNFIINDKEYYLNDYSLVKKNKMIGLGWFFDKTKNKLYSDGEKSFLIYDKKSNTESSKIYLKLIRAYKDLSFKKKS